MISYIKKIAAVLGISMFVVSFSQATTIGVFGNDSTVTSSIALGLGYDSVVLSDLSAASLSSVDVLWALNGSNSTQLGDLITFSSDVSSFVSDGGVFLYHDREVGAAETVLPGGGSFNIVRSFDDDSNIDIITDVFGGAITNTTLDGGNSSSHGYTVEGSLPGTAVGILSQTDPTHLVDFTYDWGDGFVYYSTIPLDFYLPSGKTEFSDIYAPAVLQYAAGLTGISAVPEPTSLALLGLGLAGFGFSRKKKKI